MTGPILELKILDSRLLEWGIDLHACLDSPLELLPGSAPVLVPAGFALHMADAGMAAMILPRSGLGHRKGLVLGNLVGLIDADYTGPIMVSAWHRGPAGADPIVLAPGERFAQMVFVPVLRPTFEIVDTFSVHSARGEGGFGSTGGHAVQTRAAIHETATPSRPDTL
jgi:dUTP pyrophosphatase